MLETWTPAIAPFLVTTALVLVPGVAVVFAGWRRPGVSTLLLAPAISVAVLGVAAVLAPLLGLDWTVLPVLVVTLVASAAAFVVRRFSGPGRDAPSLRTGLAAAIALVAAAAVLTYQFARAFGAPENIAQRFDNIVHLNTVRFALDTANASPFHVGATSDIPFYPSAWHALASLAASVTGADVPTAVNAANLVIVALVWPASAMAMTGLMFRGRRLALIAGAGLSTGFGAFPALFFTWGVLYPNALGYAVLPAVIGAVVALCRSARGDVLRWALVTVLLAGGAALAHPNAFLAAWILGGATAIVELGSRAALERTRRAVARVAIVAASFALATAALWPLVRTNAEHSTWEPWQSTARAAGEAALAAPRGLPVTFLIGILLAAGAIAIIRRPRFIVFAAPMIAAALLFIVSTGLPIDHALRQWLTNPWYNDGNRLAALLPIGAIPLAVWGLSSVVDLARRRLAPQAAAWERPWLRNVGLVAVGLVVFSVAIGPNVRQMRTQVHEAYTYTDDSLILSVDERALLDRLDDETPEDAVIAGSPRTGTSLAYALAGRDVLRMHIFGDIGDDERYLNRNLQDIDDDPRVCELVDEFGITHVLDFGTRDVYSPNPSAAYGGIQDLAPADRLVLVDAEGDDARLFRIEGCP